jgi:hypothetical protein
MDFSAAALLKAMIMKQQHSTRPADPKKKVDPKKNDKKPQKQDTPKGLTKEDLPDATNESIGAMGSGQRQDDN